METTARAVRLVNDIAVQFPHLSDAQAAEVVAAHVRQFWEPRMRTELMERYAAADPDFEDRARAAAGLLAARP